MNRVQDLINRESGLSKSVCYDFALTRLCVAPEDSWRGITPSVSSPDYNPDPPIFAAKFANCDGYRHMLAIANEDGNIALQDTTIRNTGYMEVSLDAPQCHNNAVFDLDWSPGEMKFISASGDHTARLWKVTESNVMCTNTYLGHTRSVKSVAFRKNDSTVFATGGRDGSIIIWDTRAQLNYDQTPRADNCIYSGHVGSPGVTQRRGHRTPKLINTSNSSSVTGLAFQDSNTLVSCGAGDGVIKVWDLRRNYTALKKEPLPKHCLPYAGTSTFKGFTNLIVNASGSRLYANCMDHSIYCYNLYSYSPVPIAVYKGLTNSTFYIKSCLSPDEKYLLSGSSDEKAYIWNLEYDEEPLLALVGHNVEVTCVAWGSTHDTPIVTCSDDARHKIWRIGGELGNREENKRKFKGYTEYLRKPKKPKLKSPIKNVELTPRSLRHLVENNERTPNTSENATKKRTFVEMSDFLNGSDKMDTQAPEAKRTRIIESRGRRLFSPSTNSTRKDEDPTDLTASSSSMYFKPLDSFENNQENNDMLMQPCTSSKIFNNNSTIPLTERPPVPDNQKQFVFNSPPTTSSIPKTTHSITPSQSKCSTTIFSPTSNLPNYVIDGEAPHLSLMSPKRSQKEKVDWLTKIRKQKMMTKFRGTSLTEKLNDYVGNCGDANTSGGMLASPRLQSIRNFEGSPRLCTSADATKTPRRRKSLTGQLNDPMSPGTPTSSRRNSETSILRFFQPRQDAAVNMNSTSCLTYHESASSPTSSITDATTTPTTALSSTNSNAIRSIHNDLLDTRRRSIHRLETIVENSTSTPTTLQTITAISGE